LQYSLSDRIRYYWPHPAIREACQTMLNNLDRSPPPLTLLSQYLPEQYQAIREGRLPFLASEIVRDGVSNVLRHYLNACTPKHETVR
jgi:D-tagatose-1,6-bisphosphate aldolase subunit GatZ/KbaZ